MKYFVQYLERMIEGCDSLGGMEREKATYQSVLKEYRKQCNIANVAEQSEHLCEVCNNDQVFETEDGFIADCPRCN